jgi:hypothetical protein
MNDRKKVIFVNGPPASGKDTAAEIIERITGARHIKFKAQLDRLLEVTYDLAPTRLRELCTREMKDVPVQDFGGRSYRNACIHMSEEIIKPNFGADYFGVILAKRIFHQHSLAKWYVISDCGFLEEVEAIVSRMRFTDALLLRMHRDGCNFDNDSRNYVDITHIHCMDVKNNDTKAILRMRLRTYIERHYGPID